MVLRQRSLFRTGLKKEITISRQWLTFVVCASVRLRLFMGIFPRKARPANYPKTHSQRRRTSVRKIFLIRPEMAKKRDSVKSIFAKLEFTVLQSNSLSPRMCLKCATEVRNAEPVIELIRKELNRSHHLFERDQK